MVFLRMTNKDDQQVFVCQSYGGLKKVDGALLWISRWLCVYILHNHSEGHALYFLWNLLLKNYVSMLDLVRKGGFQPKDAGVLAIFGFRLGTTRENLIHRNLVVAHVKKGASAK